MLLTKGANQVTVKYCVNWGSWLPRYIKEQYQKNIKVLSNVNHLNMLIISSCEYVNGIGIGYCACWGAWTAGRPYSILLWCALGLFPLVELKDAYITSTCIMHFAYAENNVICNRTLKHTFTLFEFNSNGLFLWSFFGIPFLFVHFWIL